VPVHCRMRAFDRDLIREGHYGQRPVCRANRPNTWLHRPACKREENPCQLGAVHTWHKADTIQMSAYLSASEWKEIRPSGHSECQQNERKAGATKRKFASPTLSQR